MCTLRIIVILAACFSGLGCSADSLSVIEHMNLVTTGPVSINVCSFEGNVSIQQSDDYVGTSIEVLSRVADPLEISQGSSWLRCSASVHTNDLGQEIVVELAETEGRIGRSQIQITITSSDIHGVRVKTTRGDVDVRGVSGSMDIRTSDGDVRVATRLPMTDRVSIENHRGDIMYRVRPESSGLIDATALGGESVLYVPFGGSIILPNTTREHLMATINGGENPIVLRTIDGDIRIAVTENPMRGQPWYIKGWFPF